MGLIGALFGTLFGGQRNIIKETAEVFVENAEAKGERAATLSSAALAQFAAEFAVPRQGRFGQFIDALNRVPRPALAFGTLGLFISAMVDPIWFSSRMQGIALVPEPLWWLLAAIVSFYFGSRFQAKGQDFQRSLAESLLTAVKVADNLEMLKALEQRMNPPAATGNDSIATLDVTAPDVNPALEAWRRSYAG